MSVRPKVQIWVRDMLGDPHGPWRHYENPVRVVAAHELDDVLPLLSRIEAWAEEGHVALGFVSYDAAPAMDAKLMARPRECPLPLAWFAFFEAEAPANASLPGAGPLTPSPLDWTSNQTPEEFQDALHQIKQYLVEGDIYQVNYALRLALEDAQLDPLALFAQVSAWEPNSSSACILTEEFHVLSFSPEIFLIREGRSLQSKPMKGTRPRGRTAREDDALRQELQASTKDRAENLMIVDMVRNDFGRIATPGSIHVDPLFEIEPYTTVFQMTSTVHAESDASLPEIFRALFPAASITGAPKIRASEIIHELEPTPRGLYTGALGVVGPGSRAAFNVAIRTLVHHPKVPATEYGVGSGIVWDSTSEIEFEEVMTKTKVLHPPPEFQLFESIRISATPAPGLDAFIPPASLRERHWARLLASIRRFRWPISESELRAQWDEALRSASRDVLLRVACNRFGQLRVEERPLPEWPSERPVRLQVSSCRVDSGNLFLYHKTTLRSIYDEAWAERAGSDEVVLLNERGEITEGCISNIAVRVAGQWLTPTLESGLLPGVLRQSFLNSKFLIEARLTLDDLTHAEDCIVMNSVRGSARAKLALP
ncbi:MAG TPA: aminodeoxychorismate synthase component I [Fimbriimonadaceae bacterium]|nr:aminodeoxychorismate synthase component I [Fimbriimonadaceae bacterium]HRJ33599.1 aminodeoxychorismate synthase component I [Fimbriimonadaceae bacterium]